MRRRALRDSLWGRDKIGVKCAMRRWFDSIIPREKDFKQEKKRTMSAILKVLGSGSDGNGYVIECGNESIILELGMPYDSYLMNTDLSKVKAVLVSHSHHDHFKTTVAKRFGKMGIPIYSNDEVAEISGVPRKYNSVHALKTGKAYMVGTGFIVQSFNLPHSVKNYGYLIRHNSFGKLLFATDTSAFNYKFKGVNHWLIEANYDADIIIDDKLSGMNTRSNFKDHLSKRQCLDAVKDSWDDTAESVTLIHLSNENSNAAEFQSEARTFLGFSNVNIAIGGKEAQIVTLPHTPLPPPILN